MKENLSKNNKDLVKKLTKANEKLEKFIKSSTMLEDQIQSQKIKGDISGLGFHTTEKGESSGIKNKMASKVNKTTSKKVFKPIFFVCHKPGHIASVCRNKPNRNANYNTNARYVSRKFEGHCDTCGMYGHRHIECRYGSNNPIPHMHSRPNGDRIRNFNNQVNRNWQRSYGNWFRPFEMEKTTNVVCTFCNNFGHVAMNYKKRIGRGNVGPWRSSGMVCYHYNKPGHLVKFCRSRNSKPVNSFKNQKGKQKIDVEETREDMNWTWKKKSRDLPIEETIPSPSEENPAPMT